MAVQENERTPRSQGLTCLEKVNFIFDEVRDSEIEAALTALESYRARYP